MRKYFGNDDINFLKILFSLGASVLLFILTL